MIFKDGKVEISPKGSFSFPYGAIALSRRLAEIDGQDHPERARSELKETMKKQFQRAYEDLELPESLQRQAERRGLTLYLLGGNFRGWGFLLMSQHSVSPYPIPIINGFHSTKWEFNKTAEISEVAAEESIFRISKRRAARVPAIAFLINVLVEAIPIIEDVRFAQGGVREGFLFDILDTPTKALDPLTVATYQYGTESAEHIAKLLFSGLPGANNLDRFLPETLTPPFLGSVANMMYNHCNLPKDVRSLNALLAPLTGVLACAHGSSHTERAILALVLCRRWNADLAPPYHLLCERLKAILKPHEVFWANYVGALALLVGIVYPAGRIDDLVRPRLQFHAEWSDGMGKKGYSEGVRLEIKCLENDPMTAPTSINEAVEDLEGLGKKKYRAFVRHRDKKFVVPIEVSIDRVSQ